MSAVATIARQDLRPLRRFVSAITALVEDGADEARLLFAGGGHLRDLVASDEWLPATHAQADPERYRQYLLYRDPLARFSVVSFVWGPGQRTPIHDHTIWGLVGVLRGSEIVESYDRHGGLRLTGSRRLDAGEIDRLSPAHGDIHRVSNGTEGAVSISIHVYGADIGTVQRTIYGLDGSAKPFVSGYAPAPIPDLGDA